MGEPGEADARGRVRVRPGRRRTERGQDWSTGRTALAATQLVPDAASAFSASTSMRGPGLRGRDDPGVPAHVAVVGLAGDRCSSTMGRRPGSVTRTVTHTGSSLATVELWALTRVLFRARGVESGACPGDQRDRAHRVGGEAELVHGRLVGDGGQETVDPRHAARGVAGDAWSVSVVKRVMSAKSMTACRAQARASAVATWSMCERICVFAESIEFRIRWCRLLQRQLVPGGVRLVGRVRRLHHGDVVDGAYGR